MPLWDASIELRHRDNEDGTATLTLTGTAGGGDSTTLYYHGFDNEEGVIQPTAFGSPVAGNGSWTTTDGSPGPGFYVWSAVTTRAGAYLAPHPVVGHITDPDAAVYENILNAVGDRLALVTLAGIDAAKRVRQWRPQFYQGVTGLPAVFYGPGGTIQSGGSTLCQDDIVYPVLAVFLARQQGQQGNEARNLLWLQNAARSFREGRLPGVAQVHRVTVTPDVTLDPAWFPDAGYFYSAMLLNCTAREPRGLV